MTARWTGGAGWGQEQDQTVHALRFVKFLLLIPQGHKKVLERSKAGFRWPQLSPRPQEQRLASHICCRPFMTTVIFFFKEKAIPCL